MNFASWAMVLKRMRSDALIVGAAVVTIVLAIVLLAMGPIYADAVTIAGAQRTLNDAPVTEANIAIEHRVDGAGYAASNELVTAEANRLLAPMGGEILRLGQSEPYRLPDEILAEIALTTPEDDERNRQTVFEFREGIETRATLVDGVWPGSSEPASSEFVEVALPDGAASIMAVSVGDVMDLTNRLDANLTLQARVVGIYQADDPDDPYWYGASFPVEGADLGQSVVVVGPLVTDRDSFEAQVMVRLAAVEWHIFPAFGMLDLADVPQTRGTLGALPERLTNRTVAGTPYEITTGLSPLLAEIDRGLLAARSGVFILTLQLAILAAYALVLTANLLTDVRSVEMALLRSRGAGVRQIAGFSLLEGLLLIVPAVIAGPWLAALALRLLNIAGPLAAIELQLEPQVNRASYLFAGLAGLGCLVVLLIPSLLAARSILGARAARGRETESPLLQRAGVDLALVAVAGLGFVQLRRFGSPLTETVRGRLELDPLLIAAPALGLIAGAVLALRLIPLLGRVAERISSRGNRLVAALGAWQISRRPGRYARSALLLMLALGIGLFAVAFSRTWNDSQSDQADYQIGADIVVRPDRTDRSVPRGYLGAAYEGLDGVDAAMPVSTGFVNIPTATGSGTTVFLDASRAAEIVAVRDDFAGSDIGELMQPLIDARPEIAGIPIPGEPRRIAIDVRSTISPICTTPAVVRDEVGAPGVHTYETYSCADHDTLSGWELQRFDVPLTPSVVVQDSRDRFYRITGDPLASSDALQRVEFNLGIVAANGGTVFPQYPLQVVEIELRTVRGPAPLDRVAEFSLVEILSSDQFDGDDWVPVDVDIGDHQWDLTTSPLSGNFASTSAAALTEGPGDPAHIVDLRLDTGSVGESLGFFGSQSISAIAVEASVRLVQPGSTVGIPLVASERLLVDIAFSEDPRFRLLLGGEERPVQITGLLRSFPSLDPGDEVVLIVDGPTLDVLAYIESGRIESTYDLWWLAVDDGVGDSVRAALDAPPFLSNGIETRAERAQELRTDPVALGTLGALSVGFIAAIVFAMVGFVSSAVVGARERMTEFALLRAIGLSSRQLGGWLLVENGFLVILSLLGGTLLGFLLSWLILPLITVNREAEQVYPELIVVIPWRTIFLLEAAILLLLLVVSAIMALILRRVGLGTALRIGEE